MSKDNFTKRPKKEIDFLIKVINEAFKKFTEDKTIIARGVNIKFYGSWETLFDKKTVANLKKIENDTKNNKNFNLAILLAYDGKDELLEAINKVKNKTKVHEADIKSHL
jgi:tritrans,polycis-undecaprenyl-diphosphate synthase [geranylgeranyl-diphosphate specific]